MTIVRAYASPTICRSVRVRRMVHSAYMGTARHRATQRTSWEKGMYMANESIPRECVSMGVLQNLKRTYGHLAFFEELLLDLQLLGDTSSRRSVTCVWKGSFPSARSIVSQLKKKKALTNSTSVHFAERWYVIMSSTRVPQD